jgi:hypothetical protein
MKLTFDDSDLAPLIERVARTIMQQLEEQRAAAGDHLAFGEEQAASLIGVPRHVLRDCRRRGEIKGTKVGKRIVYCREELLIFLERNKTG